MRTGCASDRPAQRPEGVGGSGGIHAATLHRPGPERNRARPGSTLRRPSRLSGLSLMAVRRRGARSSSDRRIPESGSPCPTSPGAAPVHRPPPPQPGRIGPLDRRAEWHERGALRPAWARRAGAPTAPACKGPCGGVRRRRVLAGVCGGVSQATGIDVTLVRIAFVLLSLGSGHRHSGLRPGWLLVPLEGENTTIFSRR